MFTIQHNLSGHAAHGEWQHTKAMRLAALLGTLVFVSIAVNAVTILADSGLRRASIAADCSTLSVEVERSACFDRPARQYAPHPARGANAPAFFHSF
jgi:uncharacterized membrane protein